MASNTPVNKGFLLFLAVLVFSLTFVFIARGPEKQKIPQELMAVMRPVATTLKPFTLDGKNNSKFSNQDLKDKWSFVFFGYTHCPDICPTTLVTLKQINQLLQKHSGASPAKSDFQVVFVSVDPKRDTPEGLAEYVSFFNKDFIGITGNSDKIKSFAQQFAAAYILEPPEKDGNYLVSHTSSIFLVSPEQKLLAAFSPPLVAETITEQYLKIHAMNL